MRRLVAVLVALVGMAGVLVVVLSTYFPEEDVATITPAGSVGRVEVDVQTGAVAVVAAPTNAVKVERTRKFLRGAPRTTEAVEDGVLRIHAECQRVVAVGCEVRYRIEVPSGVPVKIRAGSGPVTVDDITGMVEVDTASAAVRLNRIHGGARVRTGAGSVDGVDLMATFVDATTGAGRIRLSLADAPGRLGLETGAGSIDVALPVAEGGYRVTADAGAGRVDVSVAQDAGASRTVSAKSSAGQIRIHPR